MAPEAEIRLLPAPEDGRRVETGPVQFGEDWPGVFIRGDTALYFLEQAEKAGLTDLAYVLRSCIIRDP